jgi:hypothetical protein
VSYKAKATAERQERIDTQAKHLRGMIPGFAERLEPVYKLLDWEWAGQGIPGKDALARQMHDFLDKVVEAAKSGRKFYSISSGGLRVWWRVERDGYEELTIEYVDDVEASR